MTRDDCDCGYSFTNDDYLNAAWTIECPKCGAEYYYEGDDGACCWALSGPAE